MFKVGQKVVCIRSIAEASLEKGEIYTIREIYYGKSYSYFTGEKLTPGGMVKVEELVIPDYRDAKKEVWFDERYFHPINENFAQEALEHAREAADKEPELYTLKEVACHEQ